MEVGQCLSVVRWGMKKPELWRPIRCGSEMLTVSLKLLVYIHCVSYWLTVHGGRCGGPAVLLLPRLTISSLLGTLVIHSPYHPFLKSKFARFQLGDTLLEFLDILRQVVCQLSMRMICFSQPCCCLNPCWGLRQWTCSSCTKARIRRAGLSTNNMLAEWAAQNRCECL